MNDSEKELKRNVLCFKANWCQTCKNQLEEFENNPLNVSSINFVEIYSSNTSRRLMKAFGISDVPTTVLLSEKFNINDESSWNGSLIHKWIDFTPSDTINNFI